MVRNTVIICMGSKLSTSNSLCTILSPNGKFLLLGKISVAYKIIKCEHYLSEIGHNRINQNHIIQGNY